jgi:hypothetical protein
MARIKNQILGDVKGTVGPVVFKQIGKTQYIAKKPESFIPGTDPDSIFRRDQGAFVGKLSSKIYSLDIVKKLWSPIVKNDSRIYQKIWSENYHAANCNNLNKPAKLAPSANFIVSNPVFSFEEKSFQLKTDPLGAASEINLAKEKFILPVGVMVLKEPIPPAISPLEIIPFKGKIEILDLNSELNLNVGLPTPQDLIYMHYKFRKCYLILITLDQNDNPVHNSECFSNK